MDDGWDEVWDMSSVQSSVLSCHLFRMAGVGDELTIKEVGAVGVESSEEALVVCNTMLDSGWTPLYEVHDIAMIRDEIPRKSRIMPNQSSCNPKWHKLSTKTI